MMWVSLDKVCANCSLRVVRSCATFAIRVRYIYCGLQQREFALPIADKVAASF